MQFLADYAMTTMPLLGLAMIVICNTNLRKYKSFSNRDLLCFEFSPSECNLCTQVSSRTGYVVLHTVVLPDWTLKNGPFLMLPSSIARKSSATEAKRIFEILWGILEIIRFILWDKQLDGAWDILWIKLENGTFIASQMKSFGPKNFQIPCTDQKVPFWQFSDRARMAGHC